MSPQSRYKDSNECAVSIERTQKRLTALRTERKWWRQGALAAVVSHRIVYSYATVTVTFSWD
eukprot:2924295-Amphidinium_carterae.2